MQVLSLLLLLSAITFCGGRLGSRYWHAPHDISEYAVGEGGSPASGSRALNAASNTLHEKAPDLAIVIGSNHVRSHWLDLMPSFAIGVDEIVSSGEHDTPTAPEHALAISNSLVEQNFDLPFSTRLAFDHGISGCHGALDGELFCSPLPTVTSTIALWEAIKKSIAALPDDPKVALTASVGLSDQPPFPDWRAS